MTSLLLDRRLVSPVPAPWVAVFSGLLAHAVCVQAVCAEATERWPQNLQKKKKRTHGRQMVGPWKKQLS